MKNRNYYLMLICLAAILVLLKIYLFRSMEFPFIAAGILVLCIWCKDVFTGIGWFERKKPIVISPVDHTSRQFTKTIVGEPVSLNEKKGYLALMRELVASEFYPKLEPFLNDLKTFDDSSDAFEPLYAIGEFTDKHNIAFISMLDWKSGIEDLVWRIENALKGNYQKDVALPADTLWEPRASVSYDNVFKTYDDALREHGFQLGFMETGGDDYALMVFRSAQQAKVEEAVKLTGYGYYEIS